jgi:hypothetical protein
MEMSGYNINSMKKNNYIIYTWKYLICKHEIVLNLN